MSNEQQIIESSDVAEVTVGELIGPPAEQTADTPGNDENGDGLKGGQATADVPGDILGI